KFLLWGIQGLFIQMMNGLGASSGQLSFCRMFFSFILLALIGFIIKGKSVFRTNKKALLCSFLMGLFCQCFYNLCYSVAVKQVGMAVSAVLLYIAPVFVAIISRVLFKEGFSAIKVLALGVNVVGCALAATGGQLSFASLSAYGLLMGLGAAFMYSLSSIIGRFAADGQDPVTVNIYMFFFASLFVGLISKPWLGIENVINGSFVLYGALLALISTVIPYIIYLIGISMIDEPSKVPVFASVEMIVAALLGVLVLSEKMNVLNVVGIALVVLSIWIMNKKKKPA
ncbi:MAG: EamA family transporter, partial [Oscillospiraceae bacterium]|nr:EamA family transporter [Oscillospiraceae bacterium]